MKGREGKWEGHEGEGVEVGGANIRVLGPLDTTTQVFSNGSTLCMSPK